LGGGGGKETHPGLAGEEVKTGKGTGRKTLVARGRYVKE